MTASTPTWKLLVLGHPQLVHAAGRVLKCEGKTAALLAYLAIEGPTSRARLAPLFWPDVPDSVGRNNLIQLLGRLRRQYPAPLVQGASTLALQDVSCDAQQLLTGTSEAHNHDGEFLTDVDVSHCPDLWEWVLATRERLEEHRRATLLTEVTRLQHEGQYAQAITLTTRLLDHEPLAEDVHRRLMLLHYLNGDRSAALAAYHHCKNVLQRELHLEPDATTAALARDIDRGSIPGAPVKRTIPLAVLRPPRLVERDDAWATMEVAWAQGKTIYIAGEPGVGKTRLAQDFVRSKGAALYLQGRPGAQFVPFAGAVRNARARLAAAPHVVLPEWVKRELARVMPELRAGEPVPPLRTEADRVRFFQAHLEMVRLTSPGFVATITDDIQYYDQATMDLGVYFLSQSRSLGTHGDVPRHLIVYRQDEIAPDALRSVNRHIDAGLAVRVELASLTEQATSDLLEDLAVPNAASVAATIKQVARGNLQHTLEVVRTLFETGDFTQTPLSGPTAHLEGVIEHRLARLSPTALQTARAAAVLGSDTTVEHVTDMLGNAIYEIIGAWEELEAAQILVGERFSHDLVQDSVRNATPSAVRQILHRSAARVLQRDHAPAGVIARHWLAAQEPGHAAPFLLDAAGHAADTLRTQEAIDLYRQAALAFRASGEEDRARTAESRLERLVSA
ncbi:BTAD domain-containing putative transcriptional regulator [Deinococcus pimensis]|uniref:BTAD domain-containing putative transcriptional regulator n=1 Tax=Deinococcus pimensis TaxID=309888 RepID=UPI0004ADADB8|nr:BTAD domain-containing putative transcriptional regulator [Deinococcus pimensis]